MRKIHLWVGLLTVLAFIGTGQYMAHHQPPVVELSNDMRLMLRSRHIYILGSGLVNLMLGLYLVREPGWRGMVQSIGSGLVAVAPVLLVLAFATEPEQGFRANLPRSAFGMFALFGGCMLHLATQLARSGREMRL